MKNKVNGCNPEVTLEEMNRPAEIPSCLFSDSKTCIQFPQGMPDDPPCFECPFGMEAEEFWRRVYNTLSWMSTQIRYQNAQTGLMGRSNEMAECDRLMRIMEYMING